MNYEKLMSSANPGLIIFLIDQSYSMSDSFEAGKSKAEFAALAVNRGINEIINANADGDRIKDRCFISIIGYGQGVQEVRSDYLNALADNPIRINTIKRKMSDGAGGLVDMDYEMPEWIDAQAGNGTPMNEAFAVAHRLASEWIKQNPDSAAPVVVNISDGMPNDEPSTRKKAKEVMSLSCNDGNVLVFNAHISNGGSATKLAFPEPSDVLPDAHAKFLFDISSEVPDSYLQAAKKAELPVKPASRGYAYNADGETLVKIIQFGSSKGLQSDRMS